MYEPRRPFSEWRAGPQKVVKVLLLTFEYHDLNGPNGQTLLDSDSNLVKAAFTKLWGQDTVTERQIPLHKSQEWLIETIRAFLPTASEEYRDSLYIVYYNGHGHRNKEGKFTLLSHDEPGFEYLEKNNLPGVDGFWNTVRGIALSDGGLGRTEWREKVKAKFKHLQPPAEVPWESINDLIIRARCDTLVILDSCDAGLAAVTDTMLSADLQPGTNGCPDLWNDFRKDLIATCSWGNSTTHDRVSRSLAKVLTEAEDLWRPAVNPRGKGQEIGPRQISLGTLVRLMNVELVREQRRREGGTLIQFPQAVHYQLRRTSRKPIALERPVLAIREAEPTSSTSQSRQDEHSSPTKTTK